MLAPGNVGCRCRMHRRREQVAAAGADALLRWGGGGAARWRGSRGRGCRRRSRRCLVARVAAGCDHGAHGDECGAAENGRHATPRRGLSSCRQVLRVVDWVCRPRYARSALSMAVNSWRFGGGRRGYHLWREQVAAGGADALLGRGSRRRGCRGVWMSSWEQAVPGYHRCHRRRRSHPWRSGQRRRKLPPDADRCALGSCFNSCFTHARAPPGWDVLRSKSSRVSL